MKELDDVHGVVVYCNYYSQLEMYHSSSNCFVKELDDVHGVVVYCNYYSHAVGNDICCFNAVVTILKELDKVLVIKN